MLSTMPPAAAKMSDANGHDESLFSSNNNSSFSSLSSTDLSNTPSFALPSTHSTDAWNSNNNKNNTATMTTTTQDTRALTPPKKKNLVSPSAVQRKRLHLTSRRSEQPAAQSPKRISPKLVAAGVSPTRVTTKQIAGGAALKWVPSVAAVVAAPPLVVTPHVPEPVKEELPVVEEPKIEATPVEADTTSHGSVKNVKDDDTVDDAASTSSGGDEYTVREYEYVIKADKSKPIPQPGYSSEITRYINSSATELPSKHTKLTEAEFNQYPPPYERERVRTIKRRSTPVNWPKDQIVRGVERARKEKPKVPEPASVVEEPEPEPEQPVEEEEESVTEVEEEESIADPEPGMTMEEYEEEATDRFGDDDDLNDSKNILYEYDVLVHKPIIHEESHIGPTVVFPAGPKYQSARRQSLPFKPGTVGTEISDEYTRYKKQDIVHPPKSDEQPKRAYPRSFSMPTVSMPESPVIKIEPLPQNISKHVPAVPITPTSTTSSQPSWRRPAPAVPVVEIDQEGRFKTARSRTAAYKPGQCPTELEESLYESHEFVVPVVPPSPPLSQKQSRHQRRLSMPTASVATTKRQGRRSSLVS